MISLVTTFVRTRQLVRVFIFSTSFFRLDKAPILSNLFFLTQLHVLRSDDVQIEVVELHYEYLWLRIHVFSPRGDSAFIILFTDCACSFLCLRFSLIFFMFLWLLCTKIDTFNMLCARRCNAQGMFSTWLGKREISQKFLQPSAIFFHLHSIKLVPSIHHCSFRSTILCPQWKNFKSIRAKVC